MSMNGICPRVESMAGDSMMNEEQEDRDDAGKQHSVFLGLMWFLLGFVFQQARIEVLRKDERCATYIPAV